MSSLYRYYETYIVHSTKFRTISEFEVIKLICFYISLNKQLTGLSYF